MLCRPRRRSEELFKRQVKSSHHTIRIYCDCLRRGWLQGRSRAACGTSRGRTTPLPLFNCYFLGSDVQGNKEDIFDIWAFAEPPQRISSELPHSLQESNLYDQYRPGADRRESNIKEAFVGLLVSSTSMVGRIRQPCVIERRDAHHTGLACKKSCKLGQSKTMGEWRSFQIKDRQF